VREDEIDHECLIAKHFHELRQDGGIAWRLCLPALFKVARFGIYQAARGLDESTKQELVSEPLRKLREGMHTCKNGGHLCNRLKLIAKHLTIDCLRSAEFRKRCWLEDKDLSAKVDKLDSPKPDSPFDRLSKREIYAYLYEALSQLEQPCRAMIRERYIDDMDQMEIALRHRIGIKSVGIRILRCLDKYRILFFKVIKSAAKDTGLIAKEVLSV